MIIRYAAGATALLGTLAACGGTSTATGSSATTTGSSPPPIVVTSRPFVPSPSPSPTTLEERCAVLSTDVGVIANLTQSQSAQELQQDLDAVRAALARDAIGTPAAVQAQVRTISTEIVALQQALQSHSSDRLKSTFQKFDTEVDALLNSCTSAP